MTSLLFSILKRYVYKTNASQQVEECGESDANDDLAVKEISQLAKTLIYQQGLTTEEIENIVLRIGHLAYTGTSEASNAAGAGLLEMITLLKGRQASPNLQEKLLMSISEICYMNRNNQIKAIGVLDCLVDIMGDSENLQMSRLACYCISTIICNNYATIQYLKTIPALHGSLCRCLEVDLPWYGWAKNYGVLITDILGVGNDISILMIKDKRGVKSKRCDDVRLNCSRSSL